MLKLAVFKIPCIWFNVTFKNVPLTVACTCIKVGRVELNDAVELVDFVELERYLILNWLLYKYPWLADGMKP